MASRKTEFAGACEQAQFAEKFDRLGRQRHGMGNAHLHAASVLGIFPSGCGHNPERLVQINFRPSDAAELGAPERQIGQYLERVADNGSTLVFIYAAQEMAHSGRGCHGGVVFCPDGLEDFLEAISRVVNGITARSGKAADLPGGFGQLVCGYRVSCGFHRPYRPKNISGSELGDGHFADALIEQRNEPLFFLDIGRRVGVLLCGEPFLGYHRERERLFARGSRRFFLGGLFLCAGVDVVGEQFLGLVTLAPGFSQETAGYAPKLSVFRFPP